MNKIYFESLHYIKKILFLKIKIKDRIFQLIKNKKNKKIKIEKNYLKK